MVATAVEISERLGKRGASIRLLSMHTVSPIDVEAIEAAARETRYLVTLEEHSIVGGLGSAVAEVVSTMEGQRAPLQRLGFPPVFNSRAGDQAYLRSVHGLDSDGVLHSIEEVLEKAHGLVR